MLKESKEGLTGGLLIGLIVGLMTALFVILTVGPSGLVVALIGGSVIASIVSLIVGLTGGLLGGLLGGLRADFKVEDMPNKGIVTSAKNLLFIEAFICSTGVLLFFLNYLMPQNVISISVLKLGIAFILISVNAYGGGIAVVQHAILRFLLHRQGHIPWNYARFLRYTTERRLTQQIGGRFRFIHRELLDHFAAMDSSQQTKPTQP